MEPILDEDLTLPKGDTPQFKFHRPHGLTSNKDIAGHSEIITKYRDYVIRATDSCLQSLHELTSSQNNLTAGFPSPSIANRQGNNKIVGEEIVLQKLVDGFFKEASKFATGLIGVDRSFKLLKAATKLSKEAMQSAQGDTKPKQPELNTAWVNESDQTGQQIREPE